MAKTIRVGTEGGRPAITRTELVIKKLCASNPGLQCECILVKRPRGREHDNLLFCNEIGSELTKKRIDVAVVSGVDMPFEFPEEIAVGAVLERSDPSDAYVGRAITQVENLPPQARIGTSCIRRGAFLRAFHPRLQVVPLRGDLDGQLARLADPKAGLAGLLISASDCELLPRGNGHPVEILPRDLFVPTPGQGITSALCRRGVPSISALLGPLHSDEAALAADLERRVYRTLQGACPIPAGVYAEVVDRDLLRVTVCLSTPDGKRVITETAMGTVDDPASLADGMSVMLTRKGAPTLLESIPGWKSPARRASYSTNGRGGKKRAHAPRRTKVKKK